MIFASTYVKKMLTRIQIVSLTCDLWFARWIYIVCKFARCSEFISSIISFNILVENWSMQSGRRAGELWTVNSLNPNWWFVICWEFKSFDHSCKYNIYVLRWEIIGCPICLQSDNVQAPILLLFGDRSNPREELLTALLG